MASNSELHLMNQLLNLEGVKVKDYRIIEGIGIILSLENTQKKVLCPNCRKTTELLHQNNFQTVRDLSKKLLAVSFFDKLKLIKRRAFGFRNFDNFQLRSLLTWHFAS